MAFLCAVCYSHSSFAQCVVSGPSNATVFSNNTSAGTVAWNNPGNASTSNNSYAQASQLLSLFATANTNYLVVQGLGFTIPVAATICGISVSVERSAGGLSLGGAVKDAEVRIIKNGSITGINHANAASWPGTDAIATYGSSSDVWGVSWTPADINAGNFGIMIAASLSAGLVSVSMSARIDHVSVTVYYLNPSILPVTTVVRQVRQQRHAIGFYPNPAGNAIHIFGRRKTSAITINDMQGRLVRSVHIDPAVHLPQVTLAGISPGLYLLEIDGIVFRLWIAGQGK